MAHGTNRLCILKDHLHLEALSGSLSSTSFSIMILLHCIVKNICTLRRMAEFKSRHLLIHQNVFWTIILFILIKMLSLISKYVLTITNPTYERRVISQWQYGYEETRVYNRFVTEGPTPYGSIISSRMSFRL